MRRGTATLPCERPAVRPVRVVPEGGRERRLSVIIIGTVLGAGLFIVVVISSLSSSIDSKVIPCAISLGRRLRRHQIGDAVDLDHPIQPVQLVFVGLSMGVRGPIVGIGTSSLTLGVGARDRKALLAR